MEAEKQRWKKKRARFPILLFFNYFSIEKSKSNRYCRFETSRKKKFPVTSQSGNVLISPRQRLLVICLDFPLWWREYISFRILLDRLCLGGRQRIPSFGVFLPCSQLGAHLLHFFNNRWRKLVTLGLFVETPYFFFSDLLTREKKGERERERERGQTLIVSLIVK